MFAYFVYNLPSIIIVVLQFYLHCMPKFSPRSQLTSSQSPNGGVRKARQKKHIGTPRLLMDPLLLWNRKRRETGFEQGLNKRRVVVGG